MSKSSEVIAASIPEADRNIVGLHVNLLMNTIGGRPSDCARMAVRQYNRLGREGFIHAHAQDHETALRVCGCSACRADLDR